MEFLLASHFSLIKKQEKEANKDNVAEDIKYGDCLSVNEQNCWHPIIKNTILIIIKIKAQNIARVDIFEIPITKKQTNKPNIK